MQSEAAYLAQGFLAQPGLVFWPDDNSTDQVPAVVDTPELDLGVHMDVLLLAQNFMLGCS